MPWKLLCRKTAEQGVYLAHAKRERTAFAQGIRAETAAALADKNGYIQIGPIPKAHQST